MLERLNDLKPKDKITIICGIIILVAALFVVGTGFDKDYNIKPVMKVNSEKIKELMNKELGNNYTITIKETTNTKENKNIYYYDGRLKLYETTKSEYGYLEYNGKMYQMNGDTKELTKYNEELSFINNPFYDLDLIKEFTNNCEYEYVSENKAKCNIKLKDYLTYHNNKYATTYIGNDYNIIVEVTYSDKINSIVIDYSAFNKTVNLSDEKLIVNVTYRYNSNNFDIIYENYKDILES